MKYNNPKRVDFLISEISFGSWQLGNNIDFDFGDELEGIGLVQEALKMGVSLFDTAPNYGHGNSERLLGKALKGSRDKVFINSKFGHDDQGNTDFSIERIEKSVRESLKRLQTHYLDSVILHNPPREMLDKDHPVYNELRRLKALKLINHFGVSIDTPDELQIVLENDDVDVIELMFNVIHQSPKIHFNKVFEKGILLMIKVPLDSGWLSGKYDEFTNFTGIRARWSKEVIDTRIKIIEQVKSIVGSDIVKSSLRFILDFKAVTCVIPGIKNSSQLADNVEVSNFVLSKEKHELLETLYEDYIKNLYTPW
ncbi:MAG: aldo/keto reductase [Tenericutes bacterium HGW-Tenericutes-5]|jgi:aryl-alcohol dehydrogenase-like predicted oxidoreductase|nr:MAG: aldo/keto reductase [Tenericutes bacterium HGW-Tenericutes-5]